MHEEACLIISGADLIGLAVVMYCVGWFCTGKLVKAIVKRLIRAKLRRHKEDEHA